MLILLLADEARAIVHGDTDSNLVGSHVGAAAMPRAAMPHQHAAFCHLGWDGVDVGIAGEVVGVVPQMAARHEPGGPVCFGEVGERPHGVTHGRNMWLDQWLHLIVGMDHLRGFAWPERDRCQARHQTLGAEDTFDELEHNRVRRHLLPDLAVGQQVVGAGCAIAFEAVISWPTVELGFEAFYVLDKGIDQFRLDGIFDNGVTVVGELLMVRGQVDRHPFTLVTYGGQMDLALRGKRALVTGSSKGIGLGVADTLAAEGVDLILASRTEVNLNAAADQIRERHGVDVTTVPCDLSKSDEQARLAKIALSGPLDIVINNAGAIPGGSLNSVDEDTWRKAWDLKVFGYINLTRLLLPHLEANRSGVILNVIGAAADRPSPGYIAGAAGNSALVGFSKAIGSTSLRNGVRVLCVNPGLTITDRMTDILREQAGAKWHDPDRWEELMPDDPAPATVAQVADVVVFLVSDRAGHVTGTSITIDGGNSSR